MITIELNINGKRALGVEVSLPKAPLVLAYGKSGFVMCGYLNLDAADKLGEAAAMVRGVSTIEDLLKAKIQGVSKAATQKGVTKGMTGRAALALLL